jgi:sigma-E factor negative regulatory protein RseA
MDDKMNGNERISALADGQLQGEAFAHAVEAVCADGEALATWHAYHVVGDVLRSRELALGAPAPEFLSRLSARLAQEQPFTPAAAAVPAIPFERPPAREPAANDGTFRWKLVAGVASVAAVAAVGWSVLGSAPTGGQGPQLASAAQPADSVVLARSPTGAVMIRDARLDELLAAHRQVGAASALQMPAGFLRNATFDGPSR